jgi:hypothetical protein
MYGTFCMVHWIAADLVLELERLQIGRDWKVLVWRHQDINRLIRNWFAPPKGGASQLRLVFYGILSKYIEISPHLVAWRRATHKHLGRTGSHLVARHENECLCKRTFTVILRKLSKLLHPLLLTKLNEFSNNNNISFLTNIWADFQTKFKWVFF